MKSIFKIFILIVFPISGFSQTITSNSDTLVKDTGQIEYQLSSVFGYGGESKLAIFLPKFNLVRLHQFKRIAPYYGLELGIHGNFVSGSGSLSGLIGIEGYSFRFESSVSHFRTTKIKIDDDIINGPYSQNLINIKVGFRVKNLILKIGRSFVLNENIPNGQTRPGLLNLGKINNKIYGIELQIIL